MTPIDGSEGVDSDFANTVRPAASMAARSVKVPPTSIPIVSMVKSHRRGVTADKTLQAVALARRARALVRRSPPAAAGRADFQAIARQDLDAALLGAQLKGQLVP